MATGDADVALKFSPDSVVIDWDDILRLMNTSQKMKEDILNFLRTHPHRVPELEINEDSRTFDSFADLDAPITKLFLNNKNSGIEIYERSATSIDKFLRRHGCKITDLKLDQLSIRPKGAERAFLERFTSLEALVAKTMLREGRAPTTTAEKIEKCPGFYKFPEVYKQVKKLKIGLEKTWMNRNEVKNIVYDLMSFLEGFELPAIEEATVPCISLNQDMTLMADIFNLEDPEEDQTSGVFLISISNSIKIREAGLGPTHLKKLSFEHFYYEDQLSQQSRSGEEFASSIFMGLADLCFEQGIVMEHVNAGWFMAAPIVGHVDHDSVGKCISSIVNIHPSVIDMIKLVNLERLIVFSSRSCVSTVVRGPRFSQYRCEEISDRPEWRALKILNVTVDSAKLDKAVQMHIGRSVGSGWEPMPEMPVGHLFQFLFRKGFQQLSELTFNTKVDSWKPVENDVKMIVSSCSTVKKLGLTNWKGSDKTLELFWEGFKELEELTLESCVGIGNAAFGVGNVQLPPGS